MSIDTERIYKITEDNFYGITQGTRVIVDDKGNITGQVQNPVATIRYDDRLITVEPYQVEFIEEQESGVVWHTGDGVSVSIDDEREYHYCEGYSDWLEEMVDKKENKGITYDADGNIKSIESISDAIRDYAMYLGNESMVCSFVKGDEGNRTLNITWKEDQ